MQRTYFCIDMKSFYASVECAERGYNPFETNLVVADLTRSVNTLCLAVTPKMKSLGVKNRCRIADIPKGIRYEAAPPRMGLYIQYAADIYSIYLDYIDPKDIHVYSIDESFIDATDYIKLYNTDAFGFAKLLMGEIESRCHIPSTAGIGTNLYLAKIALDITAKHAKDHIGYLDEKLYAETLWHHRPITDFWMIAQGTAGRLARYGVYDMYGITQLPEELLYRTFGKDAELMIDHAWGRETCLMKDIKNYRSKTKSVSFSQILPRNYTYDDARTVMHEMVLNGALEMMKRKVIARKVSIFVGYASNAVPTSSGSTKLDAATNVGAFIAGDVLELYDRIADRNAAIRRLGLSFDNVCDEGCEGYSLFTDFDAVERKTKVERAVLGVRERYGKNAALKAVNFLPEGTQRERNGFIGGHKAGEGFDRI